jgi:hypothetical protein
MRLIIEMIENQKNLQKMIEKIKIVKKIKKIKIAKRIKIRRKSIFFHHIYIITINLIPKL